MSKSQIPSAVKDFVYFLARNNKAWGTSVKFIEWFNDCFIHKVKQYLSSKNVASEVLLLTVNAAGHPLILKEAHPDIDVSLFLPANTTSLIHPLDQAISARLKPNTQENLSSEFWYPLKKIQKPQSHRVEKVQHTRLVLLKFMHQ